MRHKTDYQIKMIMQHNRDGSPDHQQTRHQVLMRVVDQLRNRGYSKSWNIERFGSKEVHRLVHDWRQDGNTGRTIENKMTHIRWLSEKLGVADRIPSNADIGVGLRKSSPTYQIDKSQELKYDHLRQLDERMQLVNRLKYEFGLREKEALRFQPAVAIREDRIYLQGNWTKGGREREVMIRTQEQQLLLRDIQDFAERHPQDKSMIPANSTYHGYRTHLQFVSNQIGIRGHGLRHSWAQRLFERESGIKPPLAGGPNYKDLEKDQKQAWDRAAKIVNKELGHGEGRQDITATYIGAR